MHSPLLANLLQTLRPGDEGLLAVTLPLPYLSVSSMLAILGEGGNLDHLGEAAQLLVGNNKQPAGSAPSLVATKEEGNPKLQFQRMTEVPKKGGSLVIVGHASRSSGNTNKMLSSTFVSTKVAEKERNQGMMWKAQTSYATNIHWSALILHLFKTAC